MLWVKGGINVYKQQEEWLFLRERAAQLFEDGCTRAALRLMETINQEQIRRLEEAKYERIENC